MKQVCCARCNFFIVLRVKLLDDGRTFCSYSQLTWSWPRLPFVTTCQVCTVQVFVLVQDDSFPNTSCSYLNPCVPSILFSLINYCVVQSYYVDVHSAFPPYLCKIQLFNRLFLQISLQPAEQLNAKPIQHNVFSYL